MRPKTRYARTGGVNIAYQVLGSGPRDLVVALGWVTHLDLAWDIPPLARFYERLASFSRLIVFDKRGTGLSDPVAPDSIPTLDERMDDVRAVMDAAGSTEAALMGSVGGGAMCGLFAAMHPDRVSHLVLYAAFAQMDFDFGMVPALAPSWDEALDRIEREWDGEGVMLDLFAPSLVGNERLSEAWGRLSRASVSPHSARLLMEMGRVADWSAFLASVRVPTLVIHRSDDRVVPVAQAQKLVECIPEATLVELPGEDNVFWAGDQDAVVDEIQTFLTGEKPAREPDRILTTILFTDVAGSTELAARLGDAGWRAIVEEHDAVIRGLLEQYRGQEISTAGDSFLAIFDGPARAIQCASAIRDAVAAIGISVRAGLHTGECELVPGGGIRGLAVHIAARVASLAPAGEVLVSSTVKELVSGSSIEFLDYGVRELKGVPDEWRLFAVRA